MSPGEKRERTTIVIRHEALGDRVCSVCGRAFVGIGRCRYCSLNCANRASYWRHAEKRRAEKREFYRRRKIRQGGRSNHEHH